MVLCAFGCNREGIYKFKSGRIGCESSPNKCPKLRQNNAEKIAKLRAERGNDYWKAGIPYGTGVPTGKKGKTLSEIHGPEKAERILKALSEGHVGIVPSVETRQKISQKAKENKLGGYRPGGGRGKSGWYNGIFCDSSWELAFVIWHMDHNIPIERCKVSRQYTWNDKVRKYYPDFVVNGITYEIKGYRSPQWEAKIAEQPDIVCLFHAEIKPYLQYTVERYGKDYIKMYNSAGKKRKK
jgi:hypothetical protein